MLTAQLSLLYHASASGIRQLPLLAQLLPDPTSPNGTHPEGPLECTVLCDAICLFCSFIQPTS